jgi:hypothetical protein
MKEKKNFKAQKKVSRFLLESKIDFTANEME